MTIVRMIMAFGELPALTDLPDLPEFQEADGDGESWRDELGLEETGEDDDDGRDSGFGVDHFDHF